MKSILYLIALLLVQSAGAQIRGTVLAKGIPLEGATIKVKGEEISAVTDAQGRFFLSSKKEKPVLVISHVGYTTVAIIAGAVNNITLEESAVNLSEVTVSTGYQEIKKESTTGSYEKIGPELLNRSTSPDILSRLDGTAGSVFFSKLRSGSPEVFIRGLSTLNAATSPLIVLDNFPYEGNINTINPNDVESITILRDAAAAAIWGARAGNGVIVITTKKGQYNRRTMLSVSSNITLQQKPDIFSNRDFIGSPDFIDVEKFLFSKGKYDADLLNTTSRPVVSPVVELLAKVRAGQLSQAAADEKINALRSNDVRNDYLKYLYREGFRQQHALNVSGGNSTMSYILSGGYDNTLSNAAGNTSHRFTFHSLTAIKPFKGFEMQAGVTYSYSNTANNNIGTINPGGGKSVLYPYASLADAGENALPVDFGYRTPYLDTAGGGLLLDWKFRPLDEQAAKNNSDKLSDILFRLGMTYKVSKHLTTEVQGQYEKATENISNLYSLQTYFARNLINRYSQRLGTGIKRNIPLGSIFDNNDRALNSYALRGQVNYANEWKRNDLTVIAGAEVREARNASRSNRIYGYDDNILTFSNVDMVSSFALYGNLGTSTIPNNGGFGDGINRYTSVYANANYTYNGKYSLSASGRKDASNLFGVSSNQKGTPLWSAGTAWKISKESFYHSRLFPLLAARLTYGYNGNVVNNQAAVPTIGYNGVSGPTNLNSAYVNTLSNPDLRWERVGMINAGIDFGLSSVLEGSIDYFHKDAKDLLSAAPIDPTLGMTMMTFNTANLSGNGLDVTLTAHIGAGPLKFTARLLFSYVTNKVTRYLLDISNKGAYTGIGTSITPIVGRDPYALISYRWAGLDPQTGDPMGYLNGTVSKDYSKLVSPTSFDDLVISGSTHAPYFGNMIHTFHWKGIELSANIEYRFGNYFRRNSLNYSNLFNAWISNTEFSQRWQAPGDELITNVPSMIYPAVTNRDKFYSFSEATVEKGDLVKLQDVNLSYTYKRMRFYIIAANAGILWSANKKGIDPDYGTSQPPAPSFTFGISAGLN